MSAFHLYQRVRIVREEIYPQMNGRECVLLRVEPYVRFHDRYVPGWLVDLPHPTHPTTSNYCVLESEIEPLKYLPSPEDFASIEGLPNFDCPVRDPAVSAERVVA
jgi:hypothetical protein